MLQFTDAATIKGFRKTADGYLAGRVLCARTGCQDYLASELGLMGDGVVSVYRPEDAVFATDSLATFAGKPVTLKHPPVAVSADNWKDYAAGVVGGEIARDGDFVSVPLVLMDGGAIRAVEDGTREISMGYTCGIEMRDGVAPDGTAYQAVQTGPIRINHLAIVPKARGGEKLRIGDGADNWGIGPIAVTDKKERRMPDLIKVMVDGLQVETNDAGAAAIKKLSDALKEAEAKAAKAEEEEEKAKAKMDAAIAAKDAAEAAKLTDAALDAKVAARADLIAKAKAIVADVETAGKSDAEIRKAVVVAKLGDAAVAGKSDAYLDARFDILAEDAKPADQIKGMTVDAKAKDDLAAVYAARDKALADAYQKGYK